MSQHKQRRQEHLRRKQQRDLPRQGRVVTRSSDGVQGIITASTLSTTAQGAVVGELQVLTLSGSLRIPADEFLGKWFLS